VFLGWEIVGMFESRGLVRTGHDLIGGEINELCHWAPVHKAGTFVWAPPPAAAAVAIEELCKARIKRQDSLHIVIVPRLMTPSGSDNSTRCQTLCSRSLHPRLTGHQPCLSLLSSVSSSLLPAAPLGNLGVPRKCSEWVGKCARCLTRRTWLQGIFCANFYWSVGGFLPCHRMWCGECYTSDNELIFPYQQVDGRGGVRKRSSSGPASDAKKLGKKGKVRR
jgi:hypothetical protein